MIAKADSWPRMKSSSPGCCHNAARHEYITSGILKGGHTMEDKRYLDFESSVESNDNIDVITMFDDYESGFLAKNEKLLTWLLS